LGESHRPAPLDIYGVTKLAGERICREFYLETGIETLVCRFFNAFGPNETNPHLIPSIERQIKSGSRKINLGNLDPKRDFIHTYDMSEAVVRLMDLSFEKMEIFNLGQGKEYSVLEIINSFERQLGEKLEIVQDQSRIRKVDRSNLLADISKIKLMTGWEPVWTIDQGIKSLLESD
jgi:UDP-glucose 4-epimerase